MHSLTLFNLSGFLVAFSVWSVNTPPPFLGVKQPLAISAFRFRKRFLPLFFFRKGFPLESLHKTLINIIFCIQLSQIELPHSYALLLHPTSATKLTFEATWKMSNFRITFFERNCQPPQW